MKKTKKILLYVFYGALTVAILFFVLSIQDIGEIAGVLAGADLRYILLALLLLFVYLALYPLTLCFLARSTAIGVGFRDVYMIGMTEHFFNGITPFATGGQPFQAYAMARRHTTVASATGLLIMNFLIFMAVTNTFSLLSLIYYREFILSQGMGAVAAVGFTMNFLVLLMTLLIGTSESIRRLIVFLMEQLARIRPLRKILDRRIADFRIYTENTQRAFRELWRDKKTFSLCYLTRFLTMAAYYAITFCIIRALHVDIGLDRLPFVVLGSAFAITMVVFLPTPGSSGGIEFAFSAVFSALALGAGSSISYGGMLIWRLITYYLAMLVSFVFYILLEIRFRRAPVSEEKRKEEER